MTFWPLVTVQNEASESAVLVAVPAVCFPTVQLDEDLVSGVEVQDGGVWGVVITLILILSDGTGSHLQREEEEQERPSAQCDI